MVLIEKYSIFNALKKEYLSLEKIFVNYLLTMSFSFYLKSALKNC